MDVISFVVIVINVNLNYLTNTIKQFNCNASIRLYISKCTMICLVLLFQVFNLRNGTI